MAKIKVVHIIENLNQGGIEALVASIARGLPGGRFDVHIWCLVGRGVLADKFLAEGLVIRFFSLRSYYTPGCIRALAKALREESFDVAHCHGHFPGALGRVSALIARVPSIFSHVHTIFHGLSFRHRCIDKFLDFLSTKVIYISNNVRDSFVEQGYSFQKAIVLYNGIEGGEFVDRDFSAPDKRILTVGSLSEHKGHIYLIRAMKTIISTFPCITLQIVGDGPLRSQLNDEIKELGLEEHVSLLGLRNDVLDLLGKAHLFVLPSIREGTSLAILEGMASGLPVIASKVGGVEELVEDQKTGLLSKAGDSESLSDLMYEILKNPQKAHEMGKQGRQAYEKRFTLKIMLDDMARLYETGAC